MVFTKGWYHNNVHPMLGRHHNFESKLKNSLAHKGKVSWNKGLTKSTSEIVKAYALKIKNSPYLSENIRKSKLGKKRIFNEEWCKNLSLANIRTGKFKGKNNPGWKGGIHKPYVSQHHELPPFQWRNIRKKIIKRDGTKCKKCNVESSPPIIDHIIPYRKSKDNSLTNLQVLCRKCHTYKCVRED